MKPAAALALLVMVPATVLAATPEGQFAVQGIGRLSCDAFLEEREKKSNLYWNVGGWIDGYLTAYNVHVDETFDITPYAPTDSADSFVVLLARHCQSHGEDPIGLVVKALADEMHDKRLKRSEDAVRVDVDGRAYAVYPSMIEQLQRTLKDLGHYDGAVDGSFSDKLKTALQRYQKAEGIEVSGAPTQQTLLRILFRDGAPASQ